MKPAILTTAFLLHALALYGTEPSQNEAPPRQESKANDVESLKSEIARQRLVLDALEARLQTVQKEAGDIDSRAVVEIKITGDSYTIDGKETSKEELLTVIQAKTGDDKSWPLSIRPSRNTSYSHLRAIMQECSKGGFKKIAFVDPGKEDGQ